MKTTVQEIWLELKNAGMAQPEERRICLSGMAYLNNNRLDFVQPLDIKNGDVFSIRDREWVRQGANWIPVKPLEPNVEYRMQIGTLTCKIRRSPDGKSLLVGPDGFGDTDAALGNDSPVSFEQDEDGNFILRILGSNPDFDTNQVAVMSLGKGRNNEQE